MKYCSKCGEPNEDDVVFCSDCGNKFEVKNEFRPPEPQPQSQPQFQAQTQSTPQTYSYQPQQPAYPAYPAAYPNRIKKSSVWVTGLRILAWVGFVGIILMGIIGGIGGAVAVGQRNAGMAVLVFLLVIVVSVILAFLMVANIMIYLDLADNVLQSRQLLEQINKQQNPNNQNPGGY